MIKHPLWFLSVAIFWLVAVPAYSEGPQLQPALTLDNCFELAAKGNYDLRRAKEQIERAHGVTMQLRAGLIPHIVASADVSQIDNSRLESFNGQSFGSEKSWNADLQVEQNVFAGGGIWAGFQGKRFEERAAKNEMEMVLRDVGYGIVERFYGVLLARAQEKVNQELVSLLDEELVSEKRKRDVGSVSDFNVLRAEVELANSKAPLIRAQNNSRISIDELRRVLGLGAASHETLDVAGELVFQDFDLVLEQALERAKSNRPELQRLKNLVEAARYGVRISQAGYLPAISVYAGYGAQKSMFSNDFSDHLDGWAMGARANWSIFDGLAREGKVAEANSNLRNAKLTLEQAELDVAIDVRKALSSLHEAKELVKASHKVVEQGREGLRLARARFDVGAGTQLDVLDTQVALTQARTNEVQALHDYIIARARVERAVGDSPSGFGSVSVQ